MADVKVEKEEPVKIEADQLIYDRDQQLYHAHGQVEIMRGSLSLKADHAQLNHATKELVVWGNVLLREGEDVVECERLEVNLDTRRGKVYQARFFLKDQNFHITGLEAEKLGENHYRVKEGSFTTCDAERPPWKFTVKELEVKLGGYGVAKGPIFYIENIPVLYLPVALFPVVLERQTGFLIPQLGYSNEFGPELKTAFFWAMAKNMDSTLYFDWLGDRGFKEGLEYRYAFTKNTGGQTNFYFIDDQELNKNRYAFFGQHHQKLPYDFYLTGDINYVSDIEYPRDFDEDLPRGTRIDSRSSRQLRSTLFGGKNWDQYSFLTKGLFFEDLENESNDKTLQMLPQISFYAYPQSLFKMPLFFEFLSSYTHFWREQGVGTHRGDLFPRISFPMRLFKVLKLEPNIGFRETIYRPFDDPSDQLEAWISRETWEAGLEMSTELYRVYESGADSKVARLFKVSKWMHTIEPMIAYRYIPRVDQEEIPIFDEVDRIPYTSLISYGITTRLLGKLRKGGVESGPYEYAKLKLLQSYSLGDPLERDSKGKGRYFSNILAELWWNFSPYLSARWNAELDPYHGNFDVFNFLISTKDRRNDALQVQYRYTKDNIQEIHLGTRIRTVSPLYLFGSIRYNLVDHWKVENIYGAEYQAQCWTLGLFVEDKGRSPDGTQKKEVKIQVYLSLLNLGSMGHKPYPMQL